MDSTMSLSTMSPPLRASLGQTQRYSTQEWEAQRPRIERLYIGEQRTLNDVISVMKQDFGFVASGKQFKARITKWGLDVKNMKGNSIIAMARTRLNRKRYEAKDSAFRVNKKSVDKRKIDRYLKRKDISEEMLLSMPSPVNPPSPAFSVYTPSATTPDQCTSSPGVVYGPSLLPVTSRNFEATSPYADLFELGWLQQTCTPCAAQSSASIGMAIASPRIKPNSMIPNKTPNPVPAASRPISDASSSAPCAKTDAEISVQAFLFTAAPVPPSFPPLSDLQIDHFPMFDMSTPLHTRELSRTGFEAGIVTKNLNSLFEDKMSPHTATRSSLSGQSSRLIDLLLPGSELNARPGSARMPPRIDTQLLSQVEMTHDSVLNNDAEEIIRESQMSDPEPGMSLRNQHISRSSTTPPIIVSDDQLNRICQQRELQVGDPGLMFRFDKQICGILSVKDGSTENPWRMLVWPLARDSPALYHAIASMTAFFASKERPSLRIDGMEHMRRSIRYLATGIDKMRTDTALATTLALAFSESWDQHNSTGIEHLRGAKILVNQALISHKKRNLSGDDFARLRFLCNTWVYMDIIARLTSVDIDQSTDFDYVLGTLNTFKNTEIDPLMGCAVTLFPLIGRAANLCHKVRRVEVNSIQIISQAIELKETVEKWSPPPSATFKRPEDPTSEIQHALQTAEAYRYATLLYLHQAVPEIPSLTSAQLAKKVLNFLATVPLSSRLLIVHIYPLFTAGCEAYNREDRQWIEGRWQSMASRMWIGNIDRCWEVMQEVWARRDAAAAKTVEENAPGQGGVMVHSEISKSKCIEEMGPELTVKGRMHWVGVMKDWDWEPSLH